MPQKIRVSLLSAVVLIMCLGCSSNKANEKQQAANQQEASPTATPESPPAPAPSPEATAALEPTAKKKSRSGALPATPRESSTTAAETPTATPTPTPAPTPILVPSGTTISVRTTGPLSTSKAETNETFEASMAKPVMVGDKTVIPVGAPVKGVILKSEAAGRIKGEGGLMLQVTSLTLHGKPYKMITRAVSQQAKSRGKRSAAMIGGGGGAGALIGGLAGGKGAAIGALAGAAAGTAGATMTGKRDVVIPAETVLEFKLSAPLSLPPSEGGEAPERSPMSTPLQKPESGSQPPAQQSPTSQPPGCPE
jgi:hypothetical protein